MLSMKLLLLLLNLHVTISVFDQNQLMRYIEDLRACKNIAAVSVAVIKLSDNGFPEIDFAAGYGTTDPTEPRAPPATATTRFCIGSVTKSFTAGLAGKTVYENPEFKETLWDTPIHRMYPDPSTVLFAGTELSNIVTLRDLLSHRTGITRHDGVWTTGQSKDRKELWRNIYRFKPLQPIARYFRSSFNYNNWMYALVGHMLEEINKDSYENQIRKAYFEPLGMRTATFAHDIQSHNWIDFATHGALINGVWEKFDRNMLRVLEAASPAGAICASANDMKQYLRFLVSQNATVQAGSARAPPRAAINDVLTSVSNYAPLTFGLPYMSKPQYDFSFGTFQYNLGTGRGFYRGYDIVWHGGTFQGYLSTLFILPDMKTGIFVSTTNSADTHNDWAKLIASYAADMILNLSPAFDIRLACAFDPMGQLLAQFENMNIDFRCHLGERFNNFSGYFLHPVYDPVIVSYFKERSQLTVSFGTYGQGLLCNTTYERERNTLRIFYTDPNVQMLGLNRFYESISSGSNITFHLDSQGKADMITVYGLDDYQPEFFYRKDMFDSLFGYANSGSVKAIVIYIFLLPMSVACANLIRK